jgi:hypothetical protein
MKRCYTTGEVAAEIGVDKSTLLRWLYTGKIAEPSQQIIGGVTFRIWTGKDLLKAKKHREERYRRRPQSETPQASASTLTKGLTKKS